MSHTGRGCRGDRERARAIHLNNATGGCRAFTRAYVLAAGTSGMQIRVSDERAAQDCLFVLGWGNRCRHRNVQWLIDQLATAYRVHAVELPTHITDYRREWVGPVQEYAADLDRFDLLGHSAGGLTTAHLDADGIGNRVYLCPWWDSDFPVPGPVLDAIASLPITRPFMPIDTLDDAIGDLATAQQLAEAPSSVSPAFLRTVFRPSGRCHRPGTLPRRFAHLPTQLSTRVPSGSACRPTASGCMTAATNCSLRAVVRTLSRQSSTRYSTAPTRCEVWL